MQEKSSSRNIDRGVSTIKNRWNIDDRDPKETGSTECAEKNAGNFWKRGDRYKRQRILHYQKCERINKIIRYRDYSSFFALFRKAAM